MDYSNSVLTSEDVKKVREKLHLTQDELAKKIDVDKLTISRWETGERTCKGKYAERIKSLDQQWFKKEVKTKGKVAINIDFEDLENIVKNTVQDKNNEDEKIVIKEISIINVNNLYLR